MSGTFSPTDQTGGDLFDFVQLGDDRLFLLMGDATGHGIGPALSATQVRAMLRVALRLGASLDEAFVHVNDQLVEDLPADRFVTAFFGGNALIPSLGASGAISGVLGGYIVLHPQRRVRVLWMYQVMHVPALVAIGIWFLFQLISGAGSLGAAGGGVAYGAHIGGFVAGAVLVKMFVPRRAAFQVV